MPESGAAQSAEERGQRSVDCVLVERECMRRQRAGLKLVLCSVRRRVRGRGAEVGCIWEGEERIESKACEAERDRKIREENTRERRCSEEVRGVWREQRSRDELRDFRALPAPVPFTPLPQTTSGVLVNLHPPPFAVPCRMLALACPS